MSEHSNNRRVIVMITSPLEKEHAERIAAVDPERIKLIYRPDLMPETKYQADHNGPIDWQRPADQQREWLDLLNRAEVLLDFDWRSGLPPFELSPNLKWVQTSSAGVGQTVKRLGL